MIFIQTFDGCVSGIMIRFRERDCSIGKKIEMNRKMKLHIHILLGISLFSEGFSLLYFLGREIV